MGRKVLLLISHLIIVTLLYGCFSSDDDDTASTSTTTTTTTTTTSGTVSGLDMPDSMSIVGAKDDSGGSAFSSYFVGSKAFDDSGTNYSTDEVHTYVYDASMEALDTVNMILCLIGQTGATEMVNEGDYIAMVNEDECEQGENQSSTGETGQSSGGNAKQLNAWTINSSRASDTAAQIVKAWVPGQGGGGQGQGQGQADPMDSQTILVEITVTEEASDSKPFGDFTMNFKGVVDGSVLGGQSGTEVEMMKGSLITVDNSDDLPQFKFINLGGDDLSNSGAGFGFEEAVNVIMDDASSTSGIALAHRSESFNDGNGTQSRAATFAIGFNSTHLNRGKDDDENGTLDAEQCLSRDTFNTNVWRYNLYHKETGTFNSTDVTEGQRVELNSGFPFEYDSDNNGSNDKYGYVGYHGVWTEGGTLTDGTTISKYDYVNDTEESCTINVSSGKMVRRIAEQDLLSNFENDEFQFWGQHPTLNTFGQWIVTVDSNVDITITGSMTWGENGPEVSSTIDHDNDTNTAEVSVAATFTFNNGENVWLWSDALGGNIVYYHDTSVLAAAREVTFYGEEFVSPADSMFANGSVTLYCYERCLIGGLSQSDVDSANSEADLYYNYNGTPFQYTLSSASGKITLTDETASAAVDAGSLDMQALGFDWGINSGEMIVTALNDPNQPWLVFEESTSYRWETGSNDWNKLVTVTDGNGDISTFDPPLRFTYTHSTSNDANDDATYNGKKFMLEYGGPGELWGFPWVEDSETGRWHASITLADATELTDGTNTFVIKAIEKEQTMSAVNASECSAFDLDAILINTDVALPTETDIGTVSFSLSDKPAVTDAPAVIEGVVQD